MATHTTSTGATGFLPVDTGPLVIQPLFDASVFAQVTNQQTTNSHTFRVPTVVADPTAAWVAEGAEIPVSDPTLAELTVTPTKVAGLTIVFREMADDSDPAVAAVIGQGLARDIARRVDQAAFAALAAPAAPGLTTLSGGCRPTSTPRPSTTWTSPRRRRQSWRTSAAASPRLSPTRQPRWRCPRSSMPPVPTPPARC